MIFMTHPLLGSGPMGEPEPVPDSDQEARKVHAWRVEQLVHAGFTYDRAQFLAFAAPDYNVPIRMLRSGADPLVIERIFA